MADFVREPKEFEEKVVQVNRVSKKTAGGNQIGFSVLVVVGDKKGHVGVGLGQGPEVQSSIQKAVSYAKKHLLTVPMAGTTIPHQVYVKVGAAKVLLMPAPAGSGVIAGGAVRAVANAAGIRDISSKVLGTNNQANNVYATMEALRRLRPPKSVANDTAETTQTAEIKPVEAAAKLKEVDKKSKEKKT